MNVCISEDLGIYDNWRDGPVEYRSKKGRVWIASLLGLVLPLFRLPLLY